MGSLPHASPRCTGKWKYCKFLATKFGFCHPVTKPCPSVREPGNKHNSIVFRSLWGRFLYPAEANYQLYAKKQLKDQIRYDAHGHPGQGNAGTWSSAGFDSVLG